MNVGARPLLLAAALGVAHPLHTTVTQLAYRPGDRTVEVSVRLFADDLEAALARRSGTVELQADAYLRSSFRLLDASGAPLRLAWCGVKRTGDLVWLCLWGPAPSDLHGVRVDARMLFDLYADQINIVQASYGGRKESLVFARGDAPKPLP